MPRIYNPADIRAILETDRAWAVYALGDLAPAFFPSCEWYAEPGGGPALALLYRRFETPVLLTLGNAAALNRILDEIKDEHRMYLSLRPEALPLVRARWTVRNEMAMWRMTVAPTDFRPAPLEGVEPLGPQDVPALQRLYAEGEAAGEAPDFFSADMVEQGVFYGIWEGEALVSAAGTHIVVPSEGVAAVGSVYTRRDRRGRGLAAQVTGAVTAALLSMKLRTVALNVNQRNAAAIHVYEKLGYRCYCPFYEGVAVRDG